MPATPSKRRRRFGRELFAATEVPLDANRHRLDHDVSTHDHDFMEVALILGGRGDHRSVHGRHTLKRGDALILRPGSWHAYEQCRGLDVWNCCFGVELLRRELAWMLEDPALNYLFWAGPLALERRGIILLRLPDAALRRCEQHLRTLHDTASDAAHARAEQIGRLILLLGELAHHVGAEHRAASEKSDRIHPAVLRGTGMLEEDPSRVWTLDELSESLNIDPAYLVPLFKSATGLPPLAYLARRRAESAAAMLLRTDKPVSEIAYEVGWPDPNHFARRFRAHFGLSATTYRQRFAHPRTVPREQKEDLATDGHR